MHYCAHAVELAYLLLVNEHSPVGRRAAEYRFDVSRFEVLRHKAEAGTEDPFRTADWKV